MCRSASTDRCLTVGPLRPFVGVWNPDQYTCSFSSAIDGRFHRCLDHILIVNEQHLRRVLTEYVAFYNGARPHQGINQQIPDQIEGATGQGDLRRRTVLGGLLTDYYREAA